VRPRFDVPQAVDEGETRGLEVEVLDVQHLEAGLLELGETGVRVLVDEGESAPAGEETAVRIGPDVELDLADPFVRDLLAERRVRVFPGVEGRGELEQGREQRR